MLLMSQKGEEQKLVAVFQQSQVHIDAEHLSGGDISADEIKSRLVGCSDRLCTSSPAAHTQLILRLSAAACETNKREYPAEAVSTVLLNEHLTILGSNISWLSQIS